MSRSEDWVRLRHMRDAARTAVEIAHGPGAEVDDQRTQFALMHLMTVVGEAASRVTPETRGRLPEIPWAEVVGMRNILVHVYFDIDVPRVLQTVEHDLPSLIAAVERVLREDDRLS